MIDAPHRSFRHGYLWLKSQTRNSTQNNYLNKKSFNVVLFIVFWSIVDVTNITKCNWMTTWYNNISEKSIDKWCRKACSLNFPGVLLGTVVGNGATIIASRSDCAGDPLKVVKDPDGWLGYPMSHPFGSHGIPPDILTIPFYLSWSWGGIMKLGCRHN